MRIPLGERRRIGKSLGDELAEGTELG